MGDLLTLTPNGLYCEAGGFHIDPRRAVDRAVITHAHADHARRGSAAYLCTEDGASLLKTRLGDISVQTIAYGERLDLSGVAVSMHPAGHVLGSAQVRVERDGEVWVVTGDYKTDPDSTCRPFELVPCHTLVTECTFGLPIYRWPEPSDVFADIDVWWRLNQQLGHTSVIYAYALGKAQRVLSGLNQDTGPIYTHERVERITDVYRGEGILLPETRPLTNVDRPADADRALVVASRSATLPPWLTGPAFVSTSIASGWMRLRSRRRGANRGFILSDHVDWPQLMNVIESSGAERVLATHGYAEAVVRYVRESGLEADVLPTRFRASSVDDAT